ncbi:rhomboid family intramembrane serine protease [Chloroflexota bacterium]
MRYGYRRSGLNPILIIIIVNVVLLIATFINQEFILRNFGLWPIFFLEQPWTLLTAMFLHGSFWHLFGNMFTLFFFGTYLSQLVGNNRFMLVYFIGGICGNLLYLWLATPFSVAIGASGAVFAVGGTLAAMRPRLRVFVFPLPVPLPLWVAIVGGFLILSLIPSVAWQAHLGGLIFGVIAGYFFRKRERSFSFS